MRRRLARVPAALWACAAIAFLNGAVWAFVNPPLQGPDEIAHVTYIQYVGEWGRLPGEPPRGPGIGSDEIGVAAGSLPWSHTAQNLTWSPRGLREYRRVQPGLSRKPGSAPPATINNPPLYYAVEAVPYRVARSADFFDRLLLLRLVSALMGALTVAFTFLFVRELMPGRPWAWTVGALAVAFQPMFGFMSGSINNDNLLYMLGALLIYLVARAMRHGLTLPLAIGFGVVATAGMLNKTSFAGLLPGAVAGILVAIWRMPAPQRRRALAFSAAGAGVFVAGFGLWLVANQAVFDRSGVTTTAGFASADTTGNLSLRGHLSYIWQAFLPALPGMERFTSLGGSYVLWDTFVQGFVGRFGWWHFGFALWVNQLVLGVYLAVLALAGAGLYRARQALRRRWPELAVCILILAGYVGLVEVAAYRYQSHHMSPFEQTRYLLPLIPLYGGLVAVAATAGGRRWGPALGAFLVLLAMTHSLFAMLLVIGRYYA